MLQFKHLVFSMLFSFVFVSYAVAELNQDLLNAIEKGQLDIVRNLTSKGADVNDKDKYGCTPLPFDPSTLFRALYHLFSIFFFFFLFLLQPFSEFSPFYGHNKQSARHCYNIKY